MKIELAPTSALVRRDLPRSLWPLWPALRPEMTHSSEPMSLCPKPGYLVESAARSARGEAERATLMLQEAQSAGLLEPWELLVGQIGVLLKEGHFDAILPLLDLLVEEPSFASSLKQPKAPQGRSLIGQHPLWLLAHLAIERGAPSAILQRLLDAGLVGRVRCEPEEGSLLLLNALINGDQAGAAMLRKLGIQLNVPDQGALSDACQALERDLAVFLSGQSGEVLELADRLSWLSGSAEIRRLSAQDQRALGLASDKVAQRLPKENPLLRRLTGRVSPAQQQEVGLPRRQTGVFWRRG